MKRGYVYMMVNKKNGTIYTGVTSSLIHRVFEHKNDLNDGFTKKHKLHRLVYFEEHQTVLEAIKRESIIKSWNRQWKIDLIDSINPNWDDLYLKINQ